MTEIQVRAAIAGLFFGVWPLLMNRSGLSGNVSSAVFSGLVFLCVFPLSLSGLNGSILSVTSWPFALSAGIAGAVGVLAFNGGLAITTPETVGTFFVMMICVQIAVPAIYQSIVTGTLPVMRAGGFLLATAATYVLAKY